jgi:hypothetical protein
MSLCSFARLNAPIQKGFSLAEVLIAVTSGSRARGITMRNWINMGGGGVIDSFNSSNPLKSTNHLYDVTKCQSHGDTATLNSDGTSDPKSTYLHGNLACSSAALKKTTKLWAKAVATRLLETIRLPGWFEGNADPYRKDVNGN